MEPTLTPELALDYLKHLSTDVRAGVVLDSRGAPVAGAGELAGAVGAFLAAGDGSSWVEGRSDEGWVFAARLRDGALVIVTGPHALAGLVRHDLAEVARLLDAAASGRPGSARAPVPGAEPVSAVAVAAVHAALGRSRR